MAEIDYDSGETDARTSEAVLGGLCRAHALTQNTGAKENLGTFVQAVQDGFHELTEDFGTVWDHLSFVPSPSNVKYTCDLKLGYPRTINCEHVRLEMKEAGELVLDPKDGAIVKVAGTFSPMEFFFPNLSFREAAVLTPRPEFRELCDSNWLHAKSQDHLAMIRGVVDSLLAQYISKPFLTHSGDAAVSGSISAVAMRPHGNIRLSVQLPFDIEIASYEKTPFSGPPISACAWGVVSRHAGDVRQFPAPHG